jgi:hypothetical protein
MPKLLSYYHLPEGAIAAGATTPSNQPEGSHAWSTIENDVVIWSGGAWRKSGQTFQRYAYGVAGQNGGSYFRTAQNGGEPGVTTGFGGVILFSTNKTINQERILFGTYPAATAGGGWCVYINQAENYNLRFRYLPAPNILSTTGLALLGYNYRRLQVFGFHYNGAVFNTSLSKLDTPPLNFGGTYAPTLTAYDYTTFGGSSDLPMTSMSLDSVIYGAFMFRGAITAAQFTEMFDYIRTNGDVPYAIAGVTGYRRWSVRDALQKQKVYSGQLAPQQVEDTFTATTGAAYRTGNPILEATDLHAEHTAYGLVGFEWQANTLKTASNAGLRGSASGFWVGCLAVRQFGTPMMACGRSVDGWILTHTYARAKGIPTTGVTLTTGTLAHVAMVYDGSTLIFYEDGVRIAEIAVTGFVPSSAAEVTQFGMDSDGLYSPRTVFLGGCGGNYVPTDEEMRLVARNSLRTLRAEPIADKTQHAWSLADTLAAKGDAQPVPTTFANSFNADAMTLTQALNTKNGTGLAIQGAYGVRVGTPPNQGLQGALSGFWVAFCAQTLWTGTHQVFASCIQSSNTGWKIEFVNASKMFTITVGNAVLSSAHFTADETPICHIAFVYDGASVTVYHDGVPDSVMGCTYAVPVNTATFWGHSPVGTTSTGTPSTSFGMAGGNFIPSAAEILTAAQTSISAKKIQSIPGKTSHLWSFPDDAAENAPWTPTQFKNRISDTGHMEATANNIEIVPYAHKPWSYDVNPIYQGLKTYGDTACYRSVTPGDPVFLSTRGYWFSMLLVLHSTTTSMFRQIASYGNVFSVYSNGTNTSLQWGVRTSPAGFIAGGSCPVSAFDIERIHMFTCVFDVVTQNVRTYYKNNEFAAGVSVNAATYINSPASSLYLGYEPSVPGGNTSPDFTILGFSYGFGIPSGNEVRAQGFRTLAYETMQPIPRRTSVLVDMTKDIVEAGGVAPTNLKNRMTNTVAFTSPNPTLPAVNKIYHRHYSW